MTPQTKQKPWRKTLRQEARGVPGSRPSKPVNGVVQYVLWDGEDVVYRGSKDDCVRWWEQAGGPVSWTLHKA